MKPSIRSTAMQLLSRKPSSYPLFQARQRNVRRESADIMFAWKLCFYIDPSEMKKILGYSITGLLSLAIIFCLVLTLYLTMIKPIWHLVSYHQKPATIVSCATKSFSRGGTRYTPVAQTQDGAEVMGNVFWGSKASCESQIGNNVSVLINPGNYTEGDILSISQFGFFPAIFICVLLLIFTGIWFKKHRQPE